MSKVKKQIGDQVMITAGQFKDSVGTITSKERRGWTVELEDGQRVSVSFPMVALVQNSETQAEVETQPSEQETAAETTDSDQALEPIDQADSETQTEQTTDSDSESNEEEQDPNVEAGEQDITKMTVKQLQALAKQRGIGIARTKSDFLRIIKEKNPEEDLDQLTGKTLFNRVSELHISRLRTKADLVRMLEA
jgi:hypothetical protein